MSPFLLFYVQDRTSVENFLKGYDVAVVANDPDWTLAHTEPTAILRVPGLVTYADIVAHAKWLKAKHPPSAVERSLTRPEKIEIVGDRALVDFTTTIRYKRGLLHDERWRGHLILVWRGGTWRMWRLDEKAIGG